MDSIHAHVEYMYLYKHKFNAASHTNKYFFVSFVPGVKYKPYIYMPSIILGKKYFP